MRSPAVVTVGRSCPKNGVASLARSRSKNGVASLAYGRSSEMGDRAMEKPEVPFPKHWLYYIAIKFVVLAGAVALVLRIYDVW